MTWASSMAKPCLVVLVDQYAQVLDLLVLLRRQHVADFGRKVPARQQLNPRLSSTGWAP